MTFVLRDSVIKRPDEYSALELLSRIRTSKAIKPPAWSLSVNTDGIAPAPISCVAAYHAYVLMRDSPVCSSHPVQTLTSITVTSPITIQPSRITYMKQEKKMEIPIVCGYPMTQPAVLIAAMVADEMAYLHKPTESEVQGKFDLVPFGSLPTLIGSTTVPSATAIVPINVDKNPGVSRHTYFDYFVQDANALGRARYALGYSLPSTDRRLKLFAKSKPGKPIMMLAQHIPEMKASSSILAFYVALGLHRSVRGENNSPYSQMTSSYYLCSMPRYLDELCWKAMDIINICTMLGATKVYIASPALESFNLWAILEENDVSVILYGEPSQTTQFHEYQLSPPEDAIVYSGTKLYPPPVVKRNGTVLAESLSVAEVKQELVDCGSLYGNHVTFRHIYFHTFMETKHSFNLMPSTHAHAGHVIFLSNVNIETPPIPIATLVRRAYIANKFKTNFPIGHTTYSKYDAYQPAFLSERGLKLPALTEASAADFNFAEEDIAGMQDYGAPDDIVKYAPQVEADANCFDESVQKIPVVVTTTQKFYTPTPLFTATSTTTTTTTTTPPLASPVEEINYAELAEKED